MSPLIRTDKLVKEFGPIKAVDGISLTVEKGEVLGFLGPNGAGKSTTMKMITGFLEPDDGSVSVCDIDVWENPKQAKAHIGYLPEGAPLYGEMSPRAFLKFIAEIHGKSGSERDKAVSEAIDKTGLRKVLDQSIETLSKGFKRRVGIAQSLLHDPDILILDEPTDGLDPNQKHHVRDLIFEMAKDKSIIVSTHILEEVEAVCSRAVVIDKGKIVADGTAEQLRARLPYHNSIAILTPETEAQMVADALNAVGNVAGVETVNITDGRAKLRVLPKPGTSIATQVAAVVKEKSITIDELYVERGRLDDVFRQITSSDGERYHA